MVGICRAVQGGDEMMVSLETVLTVIAALWIIFLLGASVGSSDEQTEEFMTMFHTWLTIVSAAWLAYQSIRLVFAAVVCFLSKGV